MPGREYQAQPSRFGFNGKENDNEVKGFGNQQDYGMRIYDTRTGKFLSTDPLSQNYAGLTPYQYASNTPISAVDLDGLEMYFATDGSLIGKFGKNIEIRIVTDKGTIAKIKEHAKANISEKQNEYSYYDLSFTVINESLRILDETRNSSQPIGLASVVTSRGSIIKGKSQNGYVKNNVLITPETFPDFVEPSKSTDQNKTTIIHSHLIDAFMTNTQGGFDKLAYGDQLNVSGTIFNTGKTSELNSSDVDDMSTYNNKNYNLVLVGNIRPNKLTELNPTQTYSPKTLTAGIPGIKFQKNSFLSQGLFTMTENALRKVSKSAEKDVANMISRAASATIGVYSSKQK